MMKRLAAMMKRPAAMMKRPAAADRVADTAPDWVVEPDDAADPSNGCGQVCGLLYENMYMFFYRWYPGAGFSCSKGSITASSNLTVYKLKPGSHFIAMLIFANVVIRFIFGWVKL